MKGPKMCPYCRTWFGALEYANHVNPCRESVPGAVIVPASALEAAAIVRLLNQWPEQAEQGGLSL